MSSWAQLTHQDKEAFFSLLDEYFASRPHLVPSANQGPSVPLPSASTIRNVVSAATASQQPPPAPASPHASGDTGSPPQQPSRWGSSVTSNPHVAAASGKVSDLANRFRSSSGASSGPASGKAPAPPPPTSRTGTAGTGHLPAGLTSSKKFFGGMVSQSEKDAMKARPTGVLASAAPPRAPNSFAPPPARATGPLPSAAASPPPPPPPPPAPAAADEDEEGEMVEAMYDYDGPDADDLSFKERQIIRVVEHVNEDWAKGSIDGGPIGMFPMAYTKPI